MTNNDAFPFYDQLYRSEDGKEFIYSEFQSRLTQLKKDELDSAMVNFNALLR